MVKEYGSSEAKSTGLGVTRRLLAHGGKLMAVEFRFEKGAIVALHQHPHEQIGMVLSGRFEFKEGESTTVLGQGDSYYVAPNVVHGVVAMEAGTLLDIFTPQRHDLEPGSDA
jgi:quercetin dioxygenase-like cupin family protein